LVQTGRVAKLSTSEGASTDPASVERRLTATGQHRLRRLHPVAAYVGVAYGTYEDRFLPLGGLTINWRGNLSSLVIFDGVKVHPTLTYALGRRHVFTFLLEQSKNPGISYSISF